MRHAAWLCLWTLIVLSAVAAGQSPVALCCLISTLKRAWRNALRGAPAAVGGGK